MKKKLLIIVAVIALLIIGIVIGGFAVMHFKDKTEGNSAVSNEVAEEKEEERFLTIINDTEEVLNEVRVFVGEGTEIESAYQKNPDEKSFSIKIPKEFEEYDTFEVVAIDRYELKYEKTISNVATEGRTEVKITPDDYVEQEGDFMKKVEKWFNRD